MHLVPPIDPTDRDKIIATTEPNSLERKARLLLLESGISRRFRGFPYVFWLSDDHENSKK
ncbi:MAG: hypothetical protein WCF32_02635 [Methanoregula sp.]|jgi:hypothetical protein